jgi:Domain of unknown function (DUF4389)
MADLPVGTPVASHVPDGGPGTPDEILVAFAVPARQGRLTVLVRLILAIPHFIVLSALGVAAEVVLVICWFAALFTGRLPAGLAGFLAGYMRWTARVLGYVFLLTGRYPPFELADADYPVRIALAPGRLSRLTVALRIVLAIPAWFLATLLAYGLGTIGLLAAWLIVLVTGTMPGPLHAAIAAAVRYMTRFYGYLYLLTGTYPRGLFGDRPGPGRAEQAAGPPGYPEPGYGPSAGYAEPGYAAPGYGPPGDAAPGYGPPGDAAPGYGPPGDAEPGFGPPAPAAGWLGGDQPWRLVLPAAARALVGVFLGLGVLVLAAYIAVIAVIATHNSTLSGAAAALSVEGSYATLNTTLASFESKTAACHGNLTCVTAQDARASRAFGTFAQDVRAAAIPAAAASAADQVVSDATQARDDFQMLSKASSVSQYQQTFARTGLQQLLIKFDADYQSLGTALGAR